MLSDQNMRQQIDATLARLEANLQRRRRLKKTIGSSAAAGLMAAMNACAKPLYAGPDDAGMDAESCRTCDAAYGMDRPRPDSHLDDVDIPDVISERIGERLYGGDFPTSDLAPRDMAPLDSGEVDTWRGIDAAYGIGY